MNFAEYYNTQRDEINDRISEILHETDDDKGLRMIIQEAMKGGKRFRPTLTMLSFDVFGGEKRRHALTHASMIELIHLSSLVHDDVVDFDKTRRGNPSMWMRLLFKGLEGVGKVLPQNTPAELKPKTLTALMANNILVGDGIWALALQLIEDKEILRAVTEAVLALSEGAFKEMNSYFKVKIFGSTEEEYVQKIVGKTSSLFALSTHVGSICADASRRDRENARKLGMDLGTCYQLADDISEGDVPRKVDGKKLLEHYAKEYDEVVAKLPDNTYKDMFYELLPYMINKLMAEESQDEYFYRTTDGYIWAEEGYVNWE